MIVLPLRARWIPSIFPRIFLFLDSTKEMPSLVNLDMHLRAYL